MANLGYREEAIVEGSPSIRDPKQQASFDVPIRCHPTRLKDIIEATETTKTPDGVDPRLDVTASDGSWGDDFYYEDQKTELTSDDDASVPVCDPNIDYPELWKSIIRGDGESVQAQLDMGANIERETTDGFSPLVIAILEAQVDVAKVLLARGANVHHRVRTLPPLVHAVVQSKDGTQLIQLLLEHGAVLNSTSGPERMTLLHWASSQGVAETVHFLISKGLDLDARCTKRRTSLHLAARAGHTQVVKVLLTHGVDEYAVSSNGGNALTWAACKGHEETVKCLLGTEISVDSQDKNGHTALSLASHFGHDKVVKLLLEGGADINMRSAFPKDCTPAIAAACSNRTDVLKILIEHDCDLTLRSARGHDVLEIALIERKAGAVRVLLSALGGNNYPTESVALELAVANSHAMVKSIMATAAIMYSYMEGTSGLPNEYAWLAWVLKQGGHLIKPMAMISLMHTALEDGDLPLVSALIHHGCDINRHLESGDTPLSYAVVHRDLELIQILLNAGADPVAEIPGQNGLTYTPFDHAIIALKDGTDTEVVDMLLKTGRCRINKGRDPCATAFSYVLGRANRWAKGVADSLAIRMINSIEDVNEEKDDAGCMLLHVAVHQNREDIIDLLLGKGANIEAVADDGYTPFIFACQYSPDMIPVLIERGADAHAKYKSDAGALHAAASEGNLVALQALLDLGFDVEVETSKGFTPLACALFWGHEEAAMLLLEKGASALWTTQARLQTALHFAARNAMRDVVVELLKQSVIVDAKDNQGWTPLLDACANGSPAVVSALLDAGADIECEMPNGDRPLHVALINEYQAIAQRLIERGADVHAIASKNRSALHLAADYDVPLTVETLLEKGVSTELRDDQGRTALCYGSSAYIVRLLLEHGANARHADKDGWTPLHQAVSHRESEIAKILIAAGAGLTARTTDDGLTVEERARNISDWGDEKDGRKISVRMLMSCVAQRDFKKRKAKMMKKADEEAERLRAERIRKEEPDALDGLGERFEVVEMEAVKVE